MPSIKEIGSLIAIGTIGALGLLCILVPVLFIGAAINAFVLVHLWDWFVITKFPGVPALNMAEAYGLVLLVNWMKQSTVQTQEHKAVSPTDEKHTVWIIKDHDTLGSLGFKIFTYMIFLPLVVLGVGKFVHYYWIAV